MKNEILDSPFQDKKFDFNYSFGNYFPLPGVAFGWVLLVGGVYTLITQNLIGIILIAIGIVLVFTKSSIAFNFSSHTYKEYFSFFNYKSDSWKNIPDCEYISVFSAVESQQLNANSQSTTVRNSVIIVNLIYRKNQRLTVFKTDNKEEAFKIAHLFSDKLNLDIFDATTYEKSWITRDGTQR